MNAAHDVPTYAELEVLVAALSKPLDVLKLKEVLSAVAKAKLEPLAEQGLLDVAKTRTGAKMAALREQMKVLRSCQAAPQGIGRAEDIEDGWERNENGQKLKSEANVIHALKCSGITVRYDTFGDGYNVDGLEGYGPVLSEHAIDEMYLLLQREYNLKPTKPDFDRIVFAHARRARFHPVRDWLDGLEWDGTDRLDEWLTTYTGAESSDYCKAVGRLVLIAACRRVREPGLKFDQLMIWEGAQGTFKSTGVATLCPSRDWFSESLSLSADEKEIIEQTAGKWLIEISELAGYRKKDIEHVKTFLSRTADSARPAYGRMRQERPRQFIFVGTTNETHYMIDDTGDRRFWPVRIKKVDIEALARDRDQLWAEADYYAQRRASIHLPVELGPDAEEQQQLRAVVDEWEGPVAEWLRKTLVAHGKDHRTTMLEVAKGALFIEVAKLDPVTQKRLVRCAKKAKWQKAERSNGQNYWLPTPDALTALDTAPPENRDAVRGLL